MEFTIVNNATNESSKQVHYNNDYNKLIDIFNNKTDILNKKENLKKLNYQNTWINVNQKIINVINEN